jgi:hypothetical protein
VGVTHARRKSLWTECSLRLAEAVAQRVIVRRRVGLDAYVLYRSDKARTIEVKHVDSVLTRVKRERAEMNPIWFSAL